MSCFLAPVSPTSSIEDTQPDQPHMEATQPEQRPIPTTSASPATSSPATSQRHPAHQQQSQHLLQQTTSRRTQQRVSAARRAHWAQLDDQMTRRFHGEQRQFRQSIHRQLSLLHQDFMLLNSHMSGLRQMVEQQNHLIQNNNVLFGEIITVMREHTAALQDLRNTVGDVLRPPIPEPSSTSSPTSSSHGAN